ncbi:MAG: aldo/keto reductase [Armatimonadetes bacterium]|nr:aldo/keto reductase [Armatimonadota bacterium]
MEQQGKSLPRRRLGRSNLEVSALALGGAGLGGVYGDVSDAQAVEAVRYAVSQGINFVDTDASYGDSERKIGLALRGGLRNQVVLSTKVGTHPDRRGDYSWDGVHWNVENSLRVLGTDRLDLVLVHDPEDMGPVLAPRGAFDALQSLKAQGVIGAVGLGQRSHEWHRQAIEDGRVDVILTYADYNPIRTTAEDLLDAAARHDVGVINGSPLDFGLLTGRDPDETARQMTLKPSEQDLQSARRLYQWCRERGLPEKAVALQFSLREPRIHATLIGAKTADEIAQDLRDAAAPLPDGIWDELGALDITETE